MVYIALQERQVATTKKSHVHEEISPPITIKHTRAWAKKGKNQSFCAINVSTTHWLITVNQKITYNLILYTFSLQ